mgnify:CR=1 FL=1
MLPKKLNLLGGKLNTPLLVVSVFARVSFVSRDFANFLSLSKKARENLSLEPRRGSKNLLNPHSKFITV